MSNFVIVGAGVIGLTNAYEILKENPKNKVTVVAMHFPTDFEFKSVYTSPIAGANWESFASINDTFVQEIDAIGYDRFYELIRTRPEAGVTARKNVVLITRERFQGEGSVKRLPWFAHGSFGEKCGFRELDKEEYDLSKFEYGYEFDGMVIRTSYYMTFLINECWRLSGESEGPRARFALKRGTVKGLSEAFELHASCKRADYVINCTGLLARQLEDVSVAEREKMYPVRGVVYVARNTTGLDKVTIVEVDTPDEALYLMPRREGELIIGGCFQVGNESRDVEAGLRERILGRCREYLPDYLWDGLEIVREQVGFRPFRKGGYRIEREGRIIHCYGMGGAGFQSSYGCAQHVKKLIADADKKSSKL